MPKAEGVAITDEEGNLISQQRYLPFGGIRTNIASGPIVQTDYGYTGQRNLDEDIGLMDYKARFYSPVLNRFIQPDSIVPDPTNPQAWNRFSYNFNNPVVFVDSSGHFPIVPVILVVGIAVAGWLAFAPPAYAPSSQTDLEARSNIAESSTYTKVARWIDDHPIEYIAGITLLVYATRAALSVLAESSSTKEPQPLRNGNKFHYDEGMGPDQLEEMYPETDFAHKTRGQKGADVEIIGGKHPSEYPDSTWDPNNDYSDFKPNTNSSKYNFYKEIRDGKLPKNTQPLPYDKSIFKLLKDHFFKPK